MATYVIVHGGWAGGWYFQESERFMRAAGHEVYRPTLTGIGERMHLGSPDVNLDTHIQDIVNVLVYADLWDVLLVGYSYGRMVISGVAEVVPQRIAQLIYLDAIVPRDCESMADMLPEFVAAMEEVADAVGDGWQIPHEPPHPRKTPHPLNTWKQPIMLANADAARLPRTYVLFTGDSFSFAPFLAKTAARVQADGGRYRELAVDHSAPEDDPRAIADLLLELA